MVYTTNNTSAYDRQCFINKLNDLDPLSQTTQYYWTTPSNSFDVRNYVNPLTCALHGGVQGYTMNYSDELMGAMGGVYGMGKSMINGGNAYDDFTDYYAQVRDGAREHLELCNEKYPFITGASEITGAVFSPFKFTKMGKLGVPAIGAFAGYGAGEGDAMNQLTSTGLGIVGAYIGEKSTPYLTQGLQSQTKPAAQYLGKNMKPYLGKNYSRRINKRMNQTLVNPYTQEFMEGGLDYLFNRGARSMWGNEEENLNTY